MVFILENGFLGLFFKWFYNLVFDLEEFWFFEFDKLVVGFLWEINVLFVLSEMEYLKG